MLIFSCRLRAESSGETKNPSEAETKMALFIIAKSKTLAKFRDENIFCFLFFSVCPVEAVARLP
jgi:hypothetical protein